MGERSGHRRQMQAPLLAFPIDLRYSKVIDVRVPRRGTTSNPITMGTQTHYHVSSPIRTVKAYAVDNRCFLACSRTKVQWHNAFPGLKSDRWVQERLSTPYPSQKSHHMVTDCQLAGGVKILLKFNLDKLFPASILARLTRHRDNFDHENVLCNMGRSSRYSRGSAIPGIHFRQEAQIPNNTPFHVEGGERQPKLESTSVGLAPTTRVTSSGRMVPWV